MKIELRGLDELERRLGKAASASTLEPGMQQAVSYVRSLMSKYPHRKGNAPIEFVSDKQRRFFFAALRDGRITVPYTRTRALSNRWKTKVTVTGGDVRGVVGNNTKYGPYVQSRKFQARRFRGIWQTAEDVIEGNLTQRRVTEFLQDEIDAALAGK